MSTFIRCFFVVLVAGAATTPVSAGSPVRIATVTLPWAPEQRTLEQALAGVREAATANAQIVCLPKDCVLTAGDVQNAAALSAFSNAAQEGKLYLAVNLQERDVDKAFSASYLFGPDGAVVGKYRQTHRMPDEEIALGDDLPVFDTPFGKVGLMIGTEHYWPEIPHVLALKGAELILWSTGPDAVPQSAPLDVKMRVRAFDSHVTLACADYKGDLPYLCSNHPTYPGEPLGRSYVVDRSGHVIADTGVRTGVAVATVDLQRKRDVYSLTFKEDRSLFRYLVDPNIKPTEQKDGKRQIRVSIAQVFAKDGPNPDPESRFAKILDDAGARGSDVILMSEFGFPTNTPAAATTFEIVASKARKHGAYIVIGGLRDPSIPAADGRATSWAYMWDRSGEIVAKYRISQYGLSKELPVFKTDFGVVGLILCGDIYSPEICRAMTLQGAELILCGSQSWGPSGAVNRWMNETRAIDNGIYLATTHFPFSDMGQRSYVIDPYGQALAATPYWREGIATADIDLDAGQIWFARSKKPGPAGKNGYLAGYWATTEPVRRTDLRAVLLAGRRPELYRPIVERTLKDRDIPPETWERMQKPKSTTVSAAP